MSTKLLVSIYVPNGKITITYVVCLGKTDWNEDICRMVI